MPRGHQHLLRLLCGLALLTTWCAVGFRAAGGKRAPVLRPAMLSLTDLGLGEAVESGTVVNGILAVGAVGAALNFASYWTLQLETARLVGGVPRGTAVVEIDAQDGKNIFYLPEGCDYTAIMASSGQSKEKAAINEQLVLESVGKANGASPPGSARRQGRLRAKTQELKPKSQDVVLSLGAIGRASEPEKAIIVNEAYRILKPGGLFVLLEPGAEEEVLQLVSTFFPREINAPDVDARAATTASDVSTKKGKRRQQSAGDEASSSQDMVGGVPTLVEDVKRTKPGIVSTTISVPLRQFVSVICIRPYT